MRRERTTSDVHTPLMMIVQQRWKCNLTTLCQYCFCTSPERTQNEPAPTMNPNRTMLRVIPTMALYSADSRRLYCFNISNKVSILHIYWHMLRHSTWHRFMHSILHTLWHSTVCGIYCGILSGNYVSILSGILCGICSGILVAIMNMFTFYLA